ncbi:ETEC_3214 domain-containing protein [Streptomyces sp. NPDC054933]
MFGEPAWEHRGTLTRYETESATADVELVVRVWPLGKMGYLVTWYTSADEVAMYGLSTRSRWFRPRISVGPDHSIKLGKSRLTELPAPPTGPTGGRYAAVGARRFGYAEVHFFGNPGGYRTWIVGVSDAADNALPPLDLQDMNTGAWDEDRWTRYRTEASINSVLICGMGTLRVRDSALLPYGVGPDLDTVRLMDANTSRWARWRQQSRYRKLIRGDQRSTEPEQVPAPEHTAG